MATTDVQMCNMALGNIGVKTTIANLITEQSAEADACNTYFLQTVDEVLADFNWPEATAYATLGLVEDLRDSDEVEDWDFAYRYPTDCIKVRRIVTELGRKDPHPPPYRIGRDSQGKLIYTNEENAKIEYTIRITDYNLFSPLLVSSISWRLGAYLAPGLSRIKNMAQTAYATYFAMVNHAQVASGNEGQDDEEESEFIRARE